MLYKTGITGSELALYYDTANNAYVLSPEGIEAEHYTYMGTVELITVKFVKDTEE